MFVHRGSNLAFMLLSVAICLPVQARQVATQPRLEIGTPFLSNYSPRTYNAHAQNWAVTRDLRGVMYFGNTVGILEYDGVSWRFIRMGDNRFNIVRSLATAPDGTIYVGARKDFGYLEPDSTGQMRFVSLIPRLENKQDASGDYNRTVVTSSDVYFLSLTRLHRWSGERLATWPSSEEGTEVHHFTHAAAVRDTLYVLHTRDGLLRLDGDRLVPVPGGAFFAHTTVKMLLPWGPAGLLLGSVDRGLFVYDGASVTPFPTEADRFLKANLLSDGIRLADGSIALATLRGGLVVLDPEGSLRLRVDESAGLRNENIKAVYADAENNLWLALNDGIARVELPSPFTVFDKRHGMKDAVLSMQRYQGRLYVGTDRGLFFLDTSVQPPRLRAVSGILQQCWSIVPTDAGLLVATTGGVYEVRDGRVRLIRQGIALHLHRSVRDPRIVFVGTRDGVDRLMLSRDRWHDIGKIPQTASYIVRSIVESPDGTLWLGGELPGVVRLRPSPESAGHYDAHRLGTSAGIDGGPAQVLTIGGRLAVVTDSTVYRYVPAVSTDTAAFRPDPHLAPALTGHLEWFINAAEDAHGNVWISTWTGAGVAERGADGRYVWHRLSLLRLRDFKFQVVHPEPDGIVWLGGADGLVRYDTRVPWSHDAPFHVLIRRVTAGRDGSIPLLSSGHTSGAPMLRIPYSSNTLLFEVAATSFHDETANHFQFYLEGFDTAWWDWTSDTKKRYTNLPEGAYRMRVRARNVYDRVSDEAVFAFRILPPWYRTPWAYAAYVLLAWLLTVGLVRARTAYLVHMNSRLEAQVARRTEEIRQKNEQIRAKNELLAAQNEELRRLNALKSEFLGIAAHDLKNPLTSILGFAELLRDPFEDEKADLNAFRQQGQSFLRIIQETTDRMLHIVHGLLESNLAEYPELKINKQPADIVDLARSVVEANRVQAEAKSLQLHFVDGVPCTAEVDQHRLREAIDNLVNNAIKFSPPECNIWVSVHPGPDAERPTVHISVRDEGPGLTESDKARLFTPFERLSARPTGGESSTGLGLSIVKKIAELHGGAVRAESEGRNLGSTFTLELPAHNCQASRSD